MDALQRRSQRFEASCCVLCTAFMVTTAWTTNKNVTSRRVRISSPDSSSLAIIGDNHPNVINIQIWARLSSILRREWWHVYLLLTWLGHLPGKEKVACSYSLTGNASAPNQNNSDHPSLSLPMEWYFNTFKLLTSDGYRKVLLSRRYVVSSANLDHWLVIHLQLGSKILHQLNAPKK